MEGKYSELSGCRADDASDIGIRLKVLAGELSGLYQQLEGFKEELFPQTCNGGYLDLHAELKGLKRKKESPASGVVRFSRQSPAITDLPIPKYTVAASGTQPARYYHTTADGTLKAGATYVDIPASATEAGTGGNMSTGKISLLVSSPTGITAVNNPSPFTGGKNGEADEELRERLFYSYANTSNSINSAYYHSVATAHQGVESARVIPKKRGLGTVDVVVRSEGSWSGTEVATQLRKIFLDSREIAVDVRVEEATTDLLNLKIQLQVKDSFSFDETALRCKAVVASFVNQSSIGEPFRTSYLSREILNVEGVLNYRLVAPLADVAVLDNHIVRCGTIEIVSWGG